MTYRCIKPACDPLDCSDCNCAVPEDVYAAIRGAALEDAAKACDYLQGRQATLGRAYAVIDCATAIRALIGATQPSPAKSTKGEAT